MNGLELQDISKSFGTTPALREVSFEVARGETMCLLGPSGCGKSTLLSIVAGLETPDAGEVLWDEDSLAGVPPHRRDFGLMFQDYALFPHRNVFENVAFGLRMHGQPRAEIERAVPETLELMGLRGFERRDVHTLSGGETQRVALARSLAPHPRLLMLDEPLGALDRALREALLDELRALLRARRADQTVLYVTHDQSEAFAIADRVIVMNAGRVMQIGAPEAVYARPGSPLVARFLGLTNWLDGRMVLSDSSPAVETPLGRLPLAARGGAAPPPGTAVTVLIRPDGARLAPDGEADLEGVVANRSFRGGTVRITVRSEHLPDWTFEFPASEAPPRVGEGLQLRLLPAEMWWRTEGD